MAIRLIYKACRFGNYRVWCGLFLHLKKEWNIVYLISSLICSLLTFSLFESSTCLSQRWETLLGHHHLLRYLYLGHQNTFISFSMAKLKIDINKGSFILYFRITQSSNWHGIFTILQKLPYWTMTWWRLNIWREIVKHRYQ